MSRFLLALLGVVVMASPCAAQVVVHRPPAPSEELNTLLMHATFRITGPKREEPTKTTFGTVFILARPLKDNPSVGNIILVTAAHVLDDIGGDDAFLLVRKRNPDASYTPYQFKVRIREQGRALYVRHATADVAAMFVALPEDVPITGVTPDFLVDDKRMEEIDVHPGDEAFVLGFPLAAYGPGGFPILRSGRIASYPLTPMKAVKHFNLDLFLYTGNSGGPVYFSFVNRVYKGQQRMGLQQGMLGLVIEETRSALPDFLDKTLNIGVVAPSIFIRETIDMLPEKRLTR